MVWLVWKSCDSLHSHTSPPHVCIFNTGSGLHIFQTHMNATKCWFLTTAVTVETPKQRSSFMYKSSQRACLKAEGQVTFVQQQRSLCKSNSSLWWNIFSTKQYPTAVSNETLQCCSSSCFDSSPHTFCHLGFDAFPCYTTAQQPLLLALHSPTEPSLLT